MPMGTPTDDEPVPTRDPKAPNGGTLLTPAEIAQRRADLQAQLDALGAPDPVPTSVPDPAPALPVATVNMLDPAPDNGNMINFVPPQPAAPSPAIAANLAPTTPSPATGDNVNEDTKPFSHWLHLADGRIIKALGTFTHWHDDDNPLTPGIPVVTSVANPNFQPGTGDVRTRRTALLAELKALGFDLSDLLSIRN